MFKLSLKLCLYLFFICNVFGGISEEKCAEYEDYAYKKKSITILLDEPPIIQKTKDCNKATGLIVGGTETKPQEFPHFALLGFEELGNVSFKCGGSLISERFVLTAAHCQYHGDVEVSVIRLGEHNLFTKENVYRRDYSVEKFISHPSYNPVNRINDIALIKLNENAIISTRVRPACLHQNAREKLMGSKLIAIGFGSTGYFESSSHVLLKVNLTVINPRSCRQWIPNNLLPSQICVQGKKSESEEVHGDTCSGDSGGPLQTIINDCMYEIRAITSYGGACSFGQGAVYTRVASYILWIEGIVWK